MYIYIQSSQSLNKRDAGRWNRVLQYSVLRFGLWMNNIGKDSDAAAAAATISATT